MNRDPFLRLALLVACSLYVLGLLVVGLLFNGWALGCVLVGGIALALLASVTLDPSIARPDPRRRQRQPEEGTRGFERIS